MKHIKDALYTALLIAFEKIVFRIRRGYWL